MNGIKKIASVLLVVLLVFPVLSACTPQEAKALSGIIQNIDTVNGKITVVTKDGQTHVITIASRTDVQIDGASVSMEALEPGTEIEVELEDDRSTASSVGAKLSKVEGTISAISGNDVTIAPEKGGSAVIIKLSNNTQIKLKSDAKGTAANLKVGTKVEAKYNPDTKAALKVYVDTEEEAEIKGAISQVSGDKVTIQTPGGRTVTVAISVNTEYEDGTPADLKAGTEVEAKFDPITLVASKIEFRKGEKEVKPSAEGTEAKGTITEVSGNNVSIDIGGGTKIVVVLSPSTKIEKGSQADLKIGVMVNVRYDATTKAALKVEIETEKESKEAKIEDNFVAHLSGNEEVPPVTTQAQGQAIFHLSSDGNELEFKLTAANIESILMAHIHLAPKGQNGQPVVWLYPSAPPAVKIPGRFDGVLVEGKITTANLVGLLQGQPLSVLITKIKTGETYVNIHTEKYPSGEIRGQIAFQKED